MLKTIVKWAVFCYALLLIILGCVAYFKAGSVISLVASSGSGFLLLLCALALFMHKKAGSIVALVLTLLLTGQFAYRYALTNNLMTALLTVLSGAMLIILLLQVARWKK